MTRDEVLAKIEEYSNAAEFVLPGEPTAEEVRALGEAMAGAILEYGGDTVLAAVYNAESRSVLVTFAPRIQTIDIDVGMS